MLEKSILLRLSSTTMDRLKAIASERNCSVSELIREAIHAQHPPYKDPAPQETTPADKPIPTHPFINVQLNAYTS